MRDYTALVARIRYHIEKAKFCGLENHEATQLLKEAADALESAPAADVRPIIKAHWHDVYMTGPCSWAGTCSHCGQANDIPPPRNAHYCPNCGAQMSEAST